MSELNDGFLAQTMRNFKIQKELKRTEELRYFFFFLTPFLQSLFIKLQFSNIILFISLCNKRTTLWSVFVLISYLNNVINFFFSKYKC